MLYNRIIITVRFRLRTASDIDEVIKLAKRYKNVVGGVPDDFFSPSRMETFPPEKVKWYAG